MTSRWIALVLASASMASGHAAAASFAESDEAKFVRMTRTLEVDPLGDPDKTIRQWLVTWASDDPDITVRVCDPIGLTGRNGGPYASVLVAQTVFGNAAFQIEHPEAAGDVQSTQLAGVASALKAYAVIVGTHPPARSVYLDDLLQKQQAGTLATFLEPLVASQCTAATRRRAAPQ